MKYRWIKITGNALVWGTNDIKIEDLIRRKNGAYDCIVDTQEGTYYDPEQNDWIKIPGEGDKK